MVLLPSYVSIVFVLTTFAAVAFLLKSISSLGPPQLPSKIFLVLLPLWIVFQATLGLGGFYQDQNSIPPTILVFGVLPALLLIVTYFLLFRSSFIEPMPLGPLTLLHVVRIPVEIVLYWLFIGGQIPEVMTFEGRNFDILSGILAPIVYLTALRRAVPGKGILIAYNIVGLILLVNVVAVAVMSLPTPVQQMAFDQPNRAVLFFPYVWLPTIIVPIVLFSHLAALWKLAKGHTA